MTDPAAGITDSLARMLVRSFRSEIYSRVQHGVGVVVRDGTYPILMSLREGAANSTQLAGQLGLDRTTVSRQVSALVQHGFVERTAGVADARTEMLSLSLAGSRAADQLHENVNDLVQSAVQDWTAEERASFEPLLARLIRGLAGPDPERTTPPAS